MMHYGEMEETTFSGQVLVMMWSMEDQVMMFYMVEKEMM